MSLPDPTKPDLAAAARLEFDAPGVAPAAAAAAGEQPGDRIDRYKLLQKIGDGGMGTVWMAEQREPVVRKVALKIIKLGMDTREVVARFEAERQALALMDHPHIAKVLDGGATAGGRPFFVMELVRGVPITEYCDEAKLGLRDRLELFTKVCEAIQHAHLKGIIHRDVKPSNVLVTLHDGVPVPKVIDFGIAKATSAELTQRTMFTKFAQVVGTPEYMAPEQAELSGLDIDSRADVYSLGVLLYELLTGTKPIELGKVLEKGYYEILRTIREDEPAKPSTRVSTLGESATPIALSRHVNVETLSQRLRGDLDWIVMKALEKDRTRRYETASGFAADVGRFLRDEAVVAAPPSAAYRVRKFVRRHRTTVAAAAAIAALLVAGTIGTGVGWWKAASANEALDQALASERDERARAEANEIRATKAEEEATRRAEELEKVSEFQAARLGDLDAELMGVRLRRSLIDAAPEERRNALARDLAGINFTSIALGSLEQNLFDRTIEAIDAEFASQPVVRALLLQSVASTLHSLGLFDRASDPQRRALETFGANRGDADPLTLRSTVAAGILARSKGDLDEAERLLRGALETARRLRGESSREALDAALELALVDRYRGRYADAETATRAVAAGYRELLGDEHPSTLEALHALVEVLLIRGDFAGAEACLAETLETSRRVFGEERLPTLDAISQMGSVLQDRGLYDQAEPHFRRALEGFRRVLGDGHPVTLLSAYYLGSVLVAEGKPGAEPLLREALEGFRRVLGDEHANTMNAANALGRLLMEQGRLDAAEPLFREAVDGLRRACGADHPDTLSAINHVGLLLRDQGRFAEAEPYFREALDGYRRVLGPDHAKTLNLLLNWGEILRSIDRADEAETITRAALEGSRRVLGDDHPDTVTAVNNLGVLLLLRRDFASAEPLVREALEKNRRLLGADHLRTLGSLHNLSFLLAESGRLAEAEPFSREALEGSRRAWGDEHPQTLTFMGNRGLLLHSLGRREEGERLLREALETSRRVLPAGHPDTLAAAGELAALLESSGRVEEAAPLYRERLDYQWSRIEAVRAATPVDRELLASHLAALARSVLGTRDPSLLPEAVRAAREALTLREALFPDGHAEAWRRHHAAVVLGSALVRTARAKPDGERDAKLALLREAEPLVVPSAEWLWERFTPTPADSPLGEDRAAEAARRVVDLYEAWQSAEPGAGHDAKAAAWRERIEKRAREK